jgi:hypothetical protein
MSLTSLPSVATVRHVSLHTDGTVSPKSMLFCKPTHFSVTAALSLYTKKSRNIITICNACMSLAVKNHRLGDRLYTETAVFTVE